MSARFDKSQGFQFYYGPAIKDLKNFLPSENERSPSEISPSKEQNDSLRLDVIQSLVDQSLLHINELQQSKKQLRFLLADLKRMMG